MTVSKANMPKDSYTAIAKELAAVEKGIRAVVKDLRDVRVRVGKARDEKEIEKIRKTLR